MDTQCRGHYFRWIQNFEVIICNGYTMSRSLFSMDFEVIIILSQISLETYFRWKTLNLASTISIELVPIKDGKYLLQIVLKTCLEMNGI